MGRKKRTEITVETDQVLVIRQHRGAVRVWCEGCAEQVKGVTAEEAAAVAGVSRRTIYALVEAQKLHFSETTDGVLLICLNSLTAVTSDK